MAIRKAIISGITGMDGSHLSELLLSKGYEIYGFERRVALEDPEGRTRKIDNRVKIIPCDIRDYGSVYKWINEIQPDEFYHLAAQSFVQRSFQDPFETISTNVNGTTNILEAIRLCSPKCKYYFAATSEMFGEVLEEPQTEKTPFNPVSPYACSKLFGYFMTRTYRKSYNLFACNGILFNHEGPRRGKEFVTRKITDAVAKIKLGQQKSLTLGNLDTKRDWGYAGEYVKAMWLMLQQDKPDDYVIATNEIHTLEEFLEEAFGSVGLDWRRYVKFDDLFKRPADVVTLRGDYLKAFTKLGWQPQTKFEDLVKMMVEHDLKLNKKEDKE
jgi:GDPmannose 4,6-dehydratase